MELTIGIRLERRLLFMFNDANGSVETVSLTAVVFVFRCPRRAFR